MATASIDIYDEIEALKAERDATILAHYYQDGEIQDLADFTGDSLKLARAAATVDTGTIVFCGVHFMAETAKILNPQKRVLLPDTLAGCSLADSCPAPLLRRRQEALRAEGRRFQTVTYINSTAAVKAPLRLDRHLGQRRADHPPRPRGLRDPLRAGQAPRLLPDGSHRTAG